MAKNNDVEKVQELAEKLRKTFKELEELGIDNQNEANYFYAMREFRAMGDEASAQKCEDYYRVCKSFNTRIHSLQQRIDKLCGRILIDASGKAFLNIDQLDYDTYLDFGAFEGNVVACGMNFDAMMTVKNVLDVNNKEQQNFASVVFDKADQRFLDKLCKDQTEATCQRIINKYVATKIIGEMAKKNPALAKELKLQPEALSRSALAIEMESADGVVQNFSKMPTMLNFDFIQLPCVEVAVFANNIDRGVLRQINSLLLSDGVKVKLFTNEKVLPLVTADGRKIGENFNFFDISMVFDKLDEQAKGR